MTDSILDEFEPAHGHECAYGRKWAGMNRRCAMVTTRGKPCRGPGLIVHGDHAYCSVHIGAARERDDR